MTRDYLWSCTYPDAMHWTRRKSMKCPAGLRQMTTAVVAEDRRRPSYLLSGHARHCTAPLDARKGYYVAKLHKLSGNPNQHHYCHHCQEIETQAQRHEIAPLALSLPRFPVHGLVNAHSLPGPRMWCENTARRTQASSQRCVPQRDSPKGMWA